MKVVETYLRAPVCVRLQNGLDHTFHTVEDALDFLENEWPTRNGRHYMRAVDLCRGALNHITPAEAAREAVVSAALEAGLSLVCSHRATSAAPSSFVRAA